ncbi:MAG: hypothetical protein ABI641_01430 [Caldimonas sp.]
MLLSLDKQTVIGALKASGSKDVDVLYTTKKKLVEPCRGMKMYSWVPIICGVLLTLTVIGAFLGIPALGIGIWMRMKASKSLRIAEEAYEEYLGTIGASTVPLAAAVVA